MRSMIRQGRVAQLFGVGLLVAAGIVFATSGPSYAAVSASVSPNTGLHDTQTVHVQASGLPANTTIAVLECTRGAQSSADCEGQTLDILKQSDGSGNYDNPDYIVFVLPDSVFPTVSITCDATHSCDLFVGVNQNDFSQPHAFTPIEFADAALSPSPTPTPTQSPTPSPTPTPTHSPSATPTPTPTSSSTPSAMPTATAVVTSGGSGGDGSTVVAGEQFTTLPRTGAPTGALFLAMAGMLAMIGGSISRRLALRSR